MYVRGYLQGSENGRVVTIGKQIIVSLGHVGGCTLKHADHDHFPKEIVQFKQHTFSRAFMVRIFRVLTYIHLHAREIRLFVYQS
jgi:hypothetical protein